MCNQREIAEDEDQPTHPATYLRNHAFGEWRESADNSSADEPQKPIHDSQVSSHPRRATERCCQRHRPAKCMKPGERSRMLSFGSYSARHPAPTNVWGNAIQSEVRIVGHFHLGFCLFQRIDYLHFAVAFPFNLPPVREAT